MITESIRSILKTNLGVRKDERLLVFTDTMRKAEVVGSQDFCRRERLGDIALLVAEIGKAFAKKVVYADFPATTVHGAEPPEELWRLAFGNRTVDGLHAAGVLVPLLSKKASDGAIRKAEEIVKRYCRSSGHVVVALSNYSTSHTRFRDFLTRVCGCRYASMPLFDIAMLGGSMNVDWKALARRTVAVTRMVNKAETIEIRTPNGTLLTLSKEGRKALSDTGILTRKGAFGNLPAGETFLAPLEGTAQGELVLEWAPTRELQSPVTLVVRNGLVTEIKGKEPFSEVLGAKLKESTEHRNIAELGIGTNDRARRPDNILESEKILGTVHVALGDNSSFGGTVKTPFHQDFVFFRPTVILIDRNGKKSTLMKDGKLKEIRI
jgi:leucyl aminopeptidase (aminopeptidase T)